MIGRGALADPSVPFQVAHELGTWSGEPPTAVDWVAMLRKLIHYAEVCEMPPTYPLLMRMKQWLKLAHLHGRFMAFDSIKRARTVDEILDRLSSPAL
jgi:hypothetical protein